MRTRPFLGARVEDRLNRVVNRLLRRLGWQESVVAHTGFGTTKQVRILARLVLRPPSSLGIIQAAEDLLARRGWRNFITAVQPNAHATIVIGNQRVPVRSDRGGYLDVRVQNPGLEPGWHTVQIDGDNGSSTITNVQVIADDETFGIVSDIDDTVISTWLPRPLVAAWNSFIITEQARQAVPGMARLYQQLLADHPGAPIVFVSTGAWNTYAFMTRFMKRHGVPAGAMLLTDWGPTNTGWFRSGPEHKRTCLRELARDLPNIKWLLVGDDGQHDPDLYAEFARLQPDHVRAIAIRELSPGQHALAHLPRTSAPDFDVDLASDTAQIVRGADGDEIADKLRGLI